jgi:hypothetical protein
MIAGWWCRGFCCLARVVLSGLVLVLLNYFIGLRSGVLVDVNAAN